MNTKSFLNIVLLFCCAGQLLGQDIRQEQFSALHKYHEKSMLIRWAPKELWLFEMAQTTGYKMERAVFDVDQPAKLVFDKGRIILPVNRQSIESKTDTTDAYQLIAASLLYGAKADSMRKAPLKDASNMDEIALRNAYQQNRHFMGLLAADYSFKAAEILGLGYRDTDVEEGKTYVYRLFPVKTPKGIKADTLLLVASAAEIPAPPQQKLQGRSLEKKVMLLWPKDGLSDNYSGYTILRSRDGKKFEPLNKLPFKPLDGTTEQDAIRMQSDSATAMERLFFNSYTDSLGVNYQSYYYTLEGIDAFGMKSIITDTVSVMARDLTAPEAINTINLIQNADSTLNITWINPLNQASDIDGVYVEKGIRDDRDVMYSVLSGAKLLPSGTTSFTDKDPIKANLCYYRVNVIDTAGNVAYGIPYMHAIEDLEPPLNPERIEAVIDTSGVITIRYAASKSRDAARYRFYYAFNPKDQFIPFDSHGSSDTVFVINDFPVDQLNEFLFLKVITQDIAGNMALPTPAIAVKIPDVVPPLTPSLQQSELRDKVLYAKYEKSGSKDVLHYLIQQSVDEREWRTIETRPASVVTGPYLEILDTIQSRGVYHKIRVIAVDDDFLQSTPSDYAVGRITGKDRSKPCKNAVARFEAELNRVELSWTHDESGNTSYSIYRAIDDGRMFFLGRTEGLGAYVDRTVAGKGRYRYVIVAKTSNNAESAPVEVEVEIQ